MGWLSKIFKGSNHNMLEEHNYNGYSEDSIWNPASTSGDTQLEDEDIDRAIALSLLEEDQKDKSVLDYESQVKEDEELARALQESLKVESPPRYGHGNGSMAQPITVPYPTGYRICAGCHSEIGYGRFLSCMGGLWHPECFRCHACNLPISGYEFSMYGGYPYHKNCYKEQYHPKCGVCKQFVSKLLDLNSSLFVVALAEGI